MASTIAEATTSHNKPPVALLSGQKRKREDDDSNSQEDLGEVLVDKRATSPSLSGDDKINPSPAKKPRHESHTGTVPLLNGLSHPAIQNKYKFANPHLPTPGVHSTPTLHSNTPKKSVSVFKDLGLSYSSSDAEDPIESLVQSVRSSQVDVGSLVPPPSLPASRDGTPEFSPSHALRPWQKADSSTTSSRTPYDTSPSSSDSRKRRKRMEGDENALAGGSKPKGQMSHEDIPAWATGQESSSLKNVNKMYKSNAKKERRERKESQNPYGLMGIPTAEKVQFGAKKHRRPPAL